MITRLNETKCWSFLILFPNRMWPFYYFIVFGLVWDWRKSGGKTATVASRSESKSIPRSKRAVLIYNSLKQGQALEVLLRTLNKLPRIQAIDLWPYTVEKKRWLNCHSWLRINHQSWRTTKKATRTHTHKRTQFAGNESNQFNQIE